MRSDHRAARVSLAREAIRADRDGTRAAPRGGMLEALSDDALAGVSGGDLGNWLRAGAAGVMNLVAGETSPDLRPQVMTTPPAITTPGAVPPVKLPGGAKLILK